MIKLSVVIPAYNEAKNWQNGCLKPVQEYLASRRLDWEVIIVDDGSTDGSNQAIQAFASKNQWRFIQAAHQGKAAAIMTGGMTVKTPFVLFTDFDQATPIAEV